MLDSQLLQQLRGLVGNTVEYRGGRCRIIEILETERALVLQCEDQQLVIQGNQYGEASRRVPASHTLPLFDDAQQLHPFIRRWLD